MPQVITFCLATEPITYWEMKLDQHDSPPNPNFHIKLHQYSVLSMSQTQSLSERTLICEECGVTYAENFIQYPNNVGHPAAQLVEAMCYKPEGHGFDSR